MASTQRVSQTFHRNGSHTKHGQFCTDFPAPSPKEMGHHRGRVGSPLSRVTTGGLWDRLVCFDSLCPHDF